MSKSKKTRIEIKTLESLSEISELGETFAPTPYANPYHDSYDAKEERRAELTDLWRTNGTHNLRHVGVALKGVEDGIRAHQNVHTPARFGDQLYTVKDIALILSEVDGAMAGNIMSAMRGNSRAAGIAIYVSLALLELDGEVE